jgi:hypothetical protein
MVTARFKCVGDECGKGTFLSGDPLGYVSYKIALTPEARSARKELAYFRDTEGVPVNFFLKSLRVYSSELCP